MKAVRAAIQLYWLYFVLPIDTFNLSMCRDFWVSPPRFRLLESGDLRCSRKRKSTRSWKDDCEKAKGSGLHPRRGFSASRHRQGGVFRIERGITGASVAKLHALAELFGCEVEALLVEATRRHSEQLDAVERLLSGLSAADQKLVVRIVEAVAPVLKSAR